MDEITNLMSDKNEKKIINKLYSTSITFISIFVLILCILINYYINNPTGNINFNMMGISDLMQLCINPCNFDEDSNFPCDMNSFINTYCNDKSLEDLEFLQYSMFILKGAYLLCSTYNDSIINKIGSGVYMLTSSNTPKQSTSIGTLIALFTLLYLIIFYLTQNIKNGIVKYYFNKFFKNKFNNVLIQSAISVLMMVFTLLLFLNLGSYVSYLFWGALSSTTNNLMYIIMLIIIPFVFWIADVKLTFIEGFKEGAKNKKNKDKNKGSNSSKGKNSKCVKVENYNYVVPLIIVFIIPVVVTLKTFFTLIFRGIYGIPGILLAEDSTDIKSRIKKTVLYSFIALIIAYVFIFVSKILEIVNK